MGDDEAEHYAGLQAKLEAELYRRFAEAFPEGFIADTLENRRRAETIVEKAYEATGYPRPVLEAAFDRLAAYRLTQAVRAELEAQAAKGLVDVEAFERLDVKVDVRE